MFLASAAAAGFGAFDTSAPFTGDDRKTPLLRLPLLPQLPLLPMRPSPL
jgi:hypothetical protein